MLSPLELGCPIRKVNDEGGRLGVEDILDCDRIGCGACSCNADCAWSTLSLDICLVCDVDTLLAGVSCGGTGGCGECDAIMLRLGSNVRGADVAATRLTGRMLLRLAELRLIVTVCGILMFDSGSGDASRGGVLGGGGRRDFADCSLDSRFCIFSRRPRI